ncbi:hypothetical protein TNIN_457281 [Trichonephila inaurata madagascariensis]|uniref:Uncharacterized protein n=1 Tax=Trichonephila inaurata madagascariensis TaxID=2747483 RepID=A0A8X6JHP6_9ARAC|nr:hypothetical protein TNIN_457281 [Trichonephila inaurata madagascariensis]
MKETERNRSRFDSNMIFSRNSLTLYTSRETVFRNRGICMFKVLINDDDDHDVHDDDHGDDPHDGRDDGGDHDVRDGHDDGGDRDVHGGRGGGHGDHDGHDDDALLP